MKKPKYPYRIAILMLILTVPPIGATQLGWYLYDQQTGFDYGMIVGTFSVIYAAWLMYEKKWREKDDFFWFSNSDFSFRTLFGWQGYNDRI